MSRLSLSGRRVLASSDEVDEAGERLSILRSQRVEPPPVEDGG